MLKLYLFYATYTQKQKFILKKIENSTSFNILKILNFQKKNFSQITVDKKFESGALMVRKATANKLFFMLGLSLH